ncbi:DUF7919 family protein [Wenjunlia vitaminophila]
MNGMGGLGGAEEGSSLVHFADLSPYVFLSNTVPVGIVALNVGWLSSHRDFARGVVPEGFLDALADLCLWNRRAVTRGWHTCNFEHSEERSKSPALCTSDGNRHRLGGAEVRVICRDGRWLVAPDMVLHYIVEHGYLPPEDFVEGVLARRSAPEYYGE